MRKEDAFIQGQVEEALRNHRLLRNSGINIETRNGEVTLQGVVDVLAEKWAAAEAASQVPGVVGVDNSLTVSTDGTIDDREITEQVIKRLAADPRTDLYAISATVKDGVVYLEGNVATLAEDRAAREVAAQTRGVKEVTSYLKVERENYYFDDASVTNAVELALSRNTGLSARDIDTTTSHGVVTLRGTVDTPDQIEAAVRIASQVPGVKKVKKFLDTRHDSQKPDFQLTVEIREELGKNGLGGVKCFVSQGTVFLDGAVGTPEQKYMAEEIAGKFDGVAGISNDIQIS